MNVETIIQQLKSLKLSIAARELRSILSQYKANVCLDWFGELLQTELDQRKENSVQRRIKSARFPQLTSLEQFDFDFNPEIDTRAIKDLSTLQFIELKRIVLLLGAPGVGKTHIALALGLMATRRGFRVYCASVKRLAEDILRARSKNQLDRLFRKILSAQLWIIDDWGVVSFPREVAEEIYDLMDRRRQSSALILTSNRDVSEWSELFPDPILAGATIDRIFDRAQVLTFSGQSYRLKGRIKMPQGLTLDNSKNFH
jgi:DNA replication protein DnaC